MKLTTSWQTIESYVWNHSSGAKVTFYLEAKYSSQNIETNKSYIDTRLRSVLNVGSISGSGYNFTCSYCPTVSGSGVWNFETETITSKSNQEIEHNPDGTKSLTLTASFSNSYHGLNKTISGTVELPTIPRASSVSSSSPYIGDSATIIISSASSSFKHTLTYSFGNKTGTIATKTNLTTVPWDTNAIKSDLYAQIPDAKSGSGTITCQTYNGDTLIGTKTCNFNLYARESDCKPSIDGTVVDTNSTTTALTGNSAVMVRYMSKPKVTISASAKYRSSIKSYSINVDGQTTNSSEATFNAISSNNITISVTDSRGYSNSKALKPSIISYVNLTSNLKITRPEQTSSEAYLNGSGQWFNGSFSSSNSNTLTITAKYRKSGDSTWTSLGTLTPTKSGNTFNFSNLKLGDSFDYKNEYQFQLTISDKLQTIGNQTKDIITLSVGQPIIRVGKKKVIVNGEMIGQAQILNAKDLNELTDKFYIGYGWHLTNAPEANGWLISIPRTEDTDFIKQYFMPASTNDALYTRRCYDGTWDNWTQIPTRADINHLTRFTLKTYTRDMCEPYKNLDDPTMNALFEVRTPEINYSGQPPFSGYYPFLNIKSPDSIVMMQIAGTNGRLYYRAKQSANVNMNGVKWLRLRDSDNWGKTLYDNSSGTTGTVTLSETSSNFDYIEIFFKGQEKTTACSSVKVANPNGKKVNLSISWYSGTTYGVYVMSSDVTINGTSLTRSDSGWSYVDEGGYSSTTNNILIYKIVGYV